MMNLFKTPTVEEIHKQFELAEESVMDYFQYKNPNNKIINIDDSVKSKTELLKEIGFINNKRLIEVNKINQINEKVNIEQKEYDDKLNFLHRLKYHYPLDKFITFEQLETICKKYNLIYANIKYYGEDVPLNNLIDIKNRKELSNEFLPSKQIVINYEIYKWFGINLKTKYISPIDAKNWEKTITLDVNYNNINDSVVEYELEYYLKRKYNPKKLLSFTNVNYEIIDKSGLFIAAPKSHFVGLDKLKKNKSGFFSFIKGEVKDPIVFEFCKNDFIRIITKWGTDDDKSNLDISLINEKNN